MNGTDMEQDNKYFFVFLYLLSYSSANEFLKTSKRYITHFYILTYRNRTVSVSGRLRSVSILYSNGVISGEDKDSMKVDI